MTTKADLERKLAEQNLAALTPEYWRKCNICKKTIQYKSKYWVCNVSTCNRKRVGLVFCDVACWDAHLPGMNHRESWAEDRISPTYEDWKKSLEEDLDPTPKKRTPQKKQLDEKPAPAAPVSKPAVVLRKRSDS